MRLHNKTPLDIQHLVELSKIGACTSCFAAEFHGTKTYANEAVAKHRAISREVRRHLQTLLTEIDHCDQEVESAHKKMLMAKVI